MVDGFKEKAQFACNCFFVIFVLCGLVVVILLHLQVFPNVQDTRCKCTCPHSLQDVTNNRTVFVKIVYEKSECTCRHIIPHLEDIHCTKCTCKFEVRNNLLVKVVIISVVAAVLLLLAYTVVYCIYKCCNYYNLLKFQNGYEHINDGSSDTFSSINTTSRFRRFRRHFVQNIAFERDRGYM